MISSLPLQGRAVIPTLPRSHASAPSCGTFDVRMEQEDTKRPLVSSHASGGLGKAASFQTHMHTPASQYLHGCAIVYTFLLLIMAHFLRGRRAWAGEQHFSMSQKAFQGAWPERMPKEAEKSHCFFCLISVYTNRANTALPPSWMEYAAVARCSFTFNVCLLCLLLSLPEYKSGGWSFGSLHI